MRAAGFALAFAGAVLQAFGMLVQKKAQNAVSSVEADDDAENAQPDDLAYLSSRTWRFGFGIYLVGAICCFLAVGLWVSSPSTSLLARFPSHPLLFTAASAPACSSSFPA